MVDVAGRLSSAGSLPTAVRLQQPAGTDEAGNAGNLVIEQSSTGHEDSEPEASWASFSDIRGTGGLNDISTDRHSDAHGSDGDEYASDSSSSDIIDPVMGISGGITEFLEQEWPEAMRDAQQAVERCMLQYLREADDQQDSTDNGGSSVEPSYFIESYAALVQQHVKDKVRTMLMALVKKGTLQDGPWRQKAAAAVARDMMGDTIASCRPSKRPYADYQLTVSNILRRYLDDKLVTEIQRKTMAVQIFRAIDGSCEDDYPKLMQAAEIKADRGAWLPTLHLRPAAQQMGCRCPGKVLQACLQSSRWSSTPASQARWGPF